MAAASSLSSTSPDFGIGTKVLSVLGGDKRWPFWAGGGAKTLRTKPAP